MFRQRQTLPFFTLMVMAPLMLGVDDCEPDDPGECICTEEYAPVCGEDGNTYSNACHADCAEVPIAHDGECEIEPTYCFDDGDCDPGDHCNHDECRSPCEGDPEAVCPAVCYGVCEPEPEPEWCETDADCGPGYTCSYDDCPVCEEGEPCPAIFCAGSCVPEPTCVCPDIWAPVCGADGMTYGNACEAECVGVPVAHEGECEGCICPEIYAPVCGADGVTYDNECYASCAGVPIEHDGECRHSCICPDVWAPVCGADGNTYGNECEAGCAGVPVEHEGECGGCACPEIWDPICGADGTTYSNPCFARCAGVAVDYHGECRHTDPLCYSDEDCGLGAFCDLSECLSPCPPGEPCIDVCAGICLPHEEPPPPTPVPLPAE